MALDGSIRGSFCKLLRGTKGLVLAESIGCSGDGSEGGWRGGRREDSGRKGKMNGMVMTVNEEIRRGEGRKKERKRVGERKKRMIVKREEGNGR